MPFILDVIVWDTPFYISTTCPAFFYIPSYNLQYILFSITSEKAKILQRVKNCLVLTAEKDI